MLQLHYIQDGVLPALFPQNKAVLVIVHSSYNKIFDLVEIKSAAPSASNSLLICHLKGSQISLKGQKLDMV